MEMGKAARQQGTFSVELYLNLACPHCGHGLKRRVVDYLSQRRSVCGNCGVKLVHLARGQTTSSSDNQLDLGDLQTFLQTLEGQWTSLVNETLAFDSNGYQLDHEIAP